MGFISDIFGKGGGSSAPPPAPSMPAMPDFTAMMGSFQDMMGGAMMSIVQAQQAAQQQQADMMQQMSAMNQQSLPEINKAPDIDWSEKQKQINARAKADYNVDEARRKGRTETILTSPLLDEDEADTTGSILARGD